MVIPSRRSFSRRDFRSSPAFRAAADRLSPLAATSAVK